MSSSSLPPKNNSHAIQAGASQPEVSREASEGGEQLPDADIRRHPSFWRNLIHSKVAWLLAGLTGAGGGTLLVKSALEPTRLEQEDPKLKEFRKLVQVLVDEGNKEKIIQLVGPQADIVRERGKIWGARLEPNGTVTISVDPGLPGKRPQEKLWDKLQEKAVEALKAKGEEDFTMRIASFHATWDSNRFTEVNVFYVLKKKGGAEAAGAVRLRVDDDMNGFLMRRMMFAQQGQEMEGVAPDVLWVAPDPNVPRKGAGE